MSAAVRFLKTSLILCAIGLLAGCSTRIHVITASLLLTKDTTGPVIQVTSPNGGESWDANSSRTITWTASDAGSGLATNPIKLEYSLDGSTWTLIADHLANSGTYTWTVPFLDSWTRFTGTSLSAWTAADDLDRTHIRVRATAEDSIGNTAADESDADWTIFLSEPHVEKVVKSGSRLGYAVYYPEGHDQKDDWPVLIFLHGAGETGYGTTSDLDEVIDVHGPIKTAKTGGVTVGPRLPFVILAPQHTDWNETRFTDGTLSTWANYALDPARGYKIDDDRIHATGLSMGGAAAFNMGYYMSGQAGATGFDQLVASITPLSAYNQTTVDLSRAQAMFDGGVAAWIFHAVNDTTANPGWASIPSRPFYRYFAQILGANSSFYGSASWPASFGGNANSTSYFSPSAGISGEWVRVGGLEYGALDGDGIYQPFTDIRYLTTWNETGGHTGSYWAGVYTNRRYYEWLLLHSR